MKKFIKVENVENFLFKKCMIWNRSIFDRKTLSYKLAEDEDFEKINVKKILISGLSSNKFYEKAMLVTPLKFILYYETKDGEIFKDVDYSNEWRQYLFSILGEEYADFVLEKIEIRKQEVLKSLKEEIEPAIKEISEKKKNANNEIKELVKLKKVAESFKKCYTI